VQTLKTFNPGRDLVNQAVSLGDAASLPHSLKLPQGVGGETTASVLKSLLNPCHLGEYMDLLE
jgi:hypothetical protein